MATPDLQKYRIIEPRLDLQSSSTGAILVGGQTVNYQKQPAQSFGSSNWNFTLTPPNADAILDRVVTVTCNVVIKGNATGTGNLTLLPGFFGPRNKPISAMTQQLSATFNNITQTISLQDILPAFQRIKQPSEFLKGMGSICPDAADPYMTYGDGYLGNNNPLGPYQNMGVGSDPPRGAYPIVLNDSTYPFTNTTTAFQVEYQFTETLILPPLLFSSSDSNGSIIEQGGLTNLNNVVVQFVLGNLFRCFCFPDDTYGTGGPTIANVSAITPNTMEIIFPSAPIMNLCWISRQITMSVPQTLMYPLQSVNLYRTSQSGSVAKQGGTITCISNTLQWPSIPLKIYIWAQLASSIINSSDVNQVASTDTFLAINNISIQFNNRSGLLSSASQQQLYMMSVDNGLSMSWNEFSGYTNDINTSIESTFNTIGTVGSLLVLDPNKNFGLDGNEAISSLGNYQFQVASMSCTNQNNWQNYAQVDLNIVAVFDGYLLVNGQFYSTQLGVNSKVDVTTSPIHTMGYNEVVNMYGGGDFFSTLGNIAGKLNDLVKKSGVVSTLTGALVPGISGKLASSAIRGITGYGEEGCGKKGRLSKSSLKSLRY